MTPSLPSRDDAWPRALLAAGLLLAAVLFVYRDTALEMVAIWSRSDTFAHAFLVPPIVVWLIWRRRHDLARQTPRATPWALWPIGVAGAAWLLGDLAASNAVTQLAFTALLVLSVVAVIGPRASRTIAFPLAFLFFSVPVGEFVMPWMMQWTADFTVLGLRLSGIPVYREGLQFVVPSGNWSVVEACSGIRYLIASVMVGTLFAYLNYRSLRRRLVFTGISIVVPVVANWVRAYLIVLLGDLSGNVAAVSADHLIYGWLFFGVVITVMFVIGARWREVPAGVESRLSARGGPVFDPVPSRFAMAAVTAGAVALFIGPPLLLGGLMQGESRAAPRLAAPALLANGWRTTAAEVSWKPAFSGAAAEIDQSYSNGGPPVGLFVGYYRHQDHARKLVSSENAVVTLHDPGWSTIEEGRRRVSDGGEPLVVGTTRLRAASHVGMETTPAHRLVWQLYWINGTWTSNPGWAKVCAAFYRLLGRGDDGAVIVIHTVEGEDSTADARLTAFLEANLAILSRELTRVRDDTATAQTQPATPRRADPPPS